MELDIFKEIFNSYYDLLLGYAFRKVNDRQAAEDIVQDVFLSVWKNRKKIQFGEPIHPYLFKAVYNCSLNYLASKRHDLSINEVKTEALLFSEAIKYNQSDHLQFKEMLEKLNYFIEKLPPQCKKVFILSRKDQLKNKEIAEILNISEKTVEGHLTKALKELKDKLGKAGLICLL